MRHHFLLFLAISISFSTMLATETAATNNSLSMIEKNDSIHQISFDQLGKLSTEELLQTCVNNPLVINYILFCEGLYKFDKISKRYNGFAEFFSRENFLDVLLHEYKELPNRIDKIIEAEDSTKGAFSIKYLIYEHMLAMDESVEKIRKGGKPKDYEDVIMDGFETILNYPDIFSGIHSIPMTKIMETCVFSERSEQRLSRLLYASGNFEPVYNITTPNGTLLENVVQWVGTDLSASEQYFFIMNAIQENNVSPDSIVGAPSLKYNCHSYAWHMSQGGGMVWINGRDEIAPHPENGYYLTPYWNDGSYYECTQSDDYDLVLYAGDHSARYLGNGVYESKWGPGPIVRHQLNDVPSIYLPSQTKRFFKRVQLSLSGPTIPGAPSTYFVEDLPPSWNVTWSMQGKTSLPNYCTTNFPAANQLQINNSSKKHIKETLVAKVYNDNGALIKTLTKYINTADGFTGTYSQTIPLPNQSTSGSLSDGCLLDVQQGYNVLLTSTDFNGATVSYTSFETPTISSSGNTITFKFHNSTHFSTCLLHIVKGNKVIEFSLLADAAFHLDPDPPIIAGISSGDNSINITLNENVDSGQPMRGNAFDSWELTIYSYSTGKVVHRQKVSGRSVSIDTSAWEPDTYIVLIWIDDKEIVQKISIE